MSWEALTKHQDEQAILVPDAATYVRDWTKDVHNLIVAVERFLAPLREHKRVKCHRKTLDVFEEGLGNYSIEYLWLEFEQIPGIVEFVPKSALVRGVRLPNGAWKTGVSGRLNLSYGAITIPFTRIDHDWFIGIDGQIVPLDESTFQEAINRLFGL